MRLLSVLLLAISSAAFAAMLPCTRPDANQAICTNARFRSAAGQLAAAYAQADKHLSQFAVAAMKADETSWLAWTDTMCPATEAAAERTACLLPLYQQQTEMLTTGTKTIYGMHFYPREKVVITAESHAPRPQIHDPGYGSGRFAWPQIDRPDRAEAIWNTAAAKEASRLSDEHDPGSQDNPFNPAPLLDKQVFSSYNIAAANRRMIVLTFTQSVFPYGAAHPSETIRHMNWWLRRGRRLWATDVFRKGSGWQSFLAQASYNNLIAKAKRDHTLPYIFPEKESLPAARKAVRMTSNWTLCRDGLIVTFPSYSVAAGVYGSPSILLPWQTLKPYLNAKMHPKRLPRLTHKQKQ